jgi:hypothetical protein
MAIASARRVALLVATPGEEGADPVVSGPLPGRDTGRPLRSLRAHNLVAPEENRPNSLEIP